MYLDHYLCIFQIEQVNTVSVSSKTCWCHLFLQSKSVSNEVSGRGWREFDWANLHPNTTQNLTIGHGEGALLLVGGRTFLATRIPRWSGRDHLEEITQQPRDMANYVA